MTSLKIKSKKNGEERLFSCFGWVLILNMSMYKKLNSSSF